MSALLEKELEHPAEEIVTLNDSHRIIPPGRQKNAPTWNKCIETEFMNKIINILTWISQILINGNGESDIFNQLINKTQHAIKNMRHIQNE